MSNGLNLLLQWIFSEKKLYNISEDSLRDKFLKF